MKSLHVVGVALAFLVTGIVFDEPALEQQPDVMFEVAPAAAEGAGVIGLPVRDLQLQAHQLVPVSTQSAPVAETRDGHRARPAVPPLIPL